MNRVHAAVRTTPRKQGKPGAGAPAWEAADLTLGQLLCTTLYDLNLQPQLPCKNDDVIIHVFNIGMLAQKQREEWRDVLAAKVVSVAPRIEGMEVYLFGAGINRIRRFALAMDEVSVSNGAV